VIYIGSATRYVVDLQAGGSLVALQQNQHTSSMDSQAMRGRQVRLAWRIEHEYPVASAQAATLAGQ
jgi:putative spermidine/putrescine transport system ATP-binding protein